VQQARDLGDQRRRDSSSSRSASVADSAWWARSRLVWSRGPRIAPLIVCIARNIWWTAARAPGSRCSRSRQASHSPSWTSASTQIDDCAVPVDKAIPCGLLLNELITNALKHAFIDGRDGELRVELARIDHNIRLVVADNGVGLPSDLDVAGTRSLGLRLVNTLVRQLRATLAVGACDGARFELDFAVEN
jgi:hypothetical protein